MLLAAPRAAAPRAPARRALRAPPPARDWRDPTPPPPAPAASPASGTFRETVEERRAKAAMLREYLVRRSAYFAALDADGDGRIDADEMLAALRELGAETVTRGHVEAIIAEGDANGDGAIDQRELLRLLTQHSALQGLDLLK